MYGLWMMRRSVAAWGSAGFFVVAPGVVAGVIPGWVTGWWDRGDAPAYLVPLRAVGVLLVVAGVAVLVPAFVRFVAEGIGTPAPAAPTEQLVVGGLYRHVRNPMYLAVIAIVVGPALRLARPGRGVYAAVAAAAMVSFVTWYEEPALRRQHGEAYDAYRRAVPGWLPRPGR